MSETISLSVWTGLARASGYDAKRECLNQNVGRWLVVMGKMGGWVRGSETTAEFTKDLKRATEVAPELVM